MHKTNRLFVLAIPLLAALMLALLAFSIDGDPSASAAPPQLPTAATHGQTAGQPSLVVSNSGPTRLGELSIFTAVVTTTAAITFEWNFGDGTSFVDVATGRSTVSHTYTATNEYMATVRAVFSNSESVVTTSILVEDGYRVYIPAIPLPRVATAQLGAQFADHLRTFYTDTARISADLTTVHDVGGRWLRLHVPWNEIETSPGSYDWTFMDEIFNQVEAANLQPLPTIWGVPTWAADVDCGPIADHESFRNFLGVLIQRYEERVTAWEFINEPDARERYVWGPLIGCYGLAPAAYAEDLALFHGAVRQHDPTALVVMGGMAYDNWAIFEETFWDKTLAAGAGNYFDVANFHYYPITLDRFPSIVDKANEIKATMAANGVAGKQIWVTETSFWFNLNSSVEAQKNFIVQEQARAYAAGIDNLFWFDIKERPYIPDDAGHRWLYSVDHQPLPGYGTYELFASKIRGLIIKGRVTDFPTEVEAYRFVDGTSGDERTVTVAWSVGTTQTVTIDSTSPITITSRDGDSVITVMPEAGQAQVEIGPLPLYIESHNNVESSNN